MNMIYKMKLHEVVMLNEYQVIRVPGGWIYTHISDNESSTFVHFNNEFQEQEVPK